MKNPTRYFLSTALLLCSYICTRAQVVDSILLLSSADAGITIPNPGSLSPPRELTIAFWLKSSTKSFSNQSQVILSKRNYRTLDHFSNATNWQMYDATNASGQNDVRGFVGGAFDGRYVYCSPWWKGPTQSGKILRYDTKVPYEHSTGWTVYDAENEDGFQNLRGFEGNVFDGRFVYFVPLHRDGEYFAHVLRYDTHGDFSNPDSWDVFDAGQIDPSEIMKGFVGSVFDGINIYFVPNPFAPHSRILKFNTTKTFNDPTAWSYFDLWDIPTYMANNGFFGGIFDGRYVYLVPFNGLGTVVRLDTSQDFLSKDSWSTVDFNYILGGRVHGTYTGAAFDGRYVYFSPMSGGNVVRLDTSEDFFDPSAWQVTKILNLDGTYDVQGGVGPTYDGRYVYFPPMAAAEGRSGKLVVYDTQQEFADLSSWRHIDLSSNDSNLKGFEGAVYDGQYVYFFPMNFHEPHGKIPRYKTYQDGDLSFEIQFSGSSSSFGSVPGKLSFSVGTTAGTRSTFLAGGEHNLLDNQWHHVAVTYDGNSVQLFVDGILESQNTFNESAPLIWNDANMIIGNSEGSSTNAYRGLLNDVGMWQRAFDEVQIQDLIKEGPSLNDNNLIAYWPFDTGMQSAKVEDASANGNHGLGAYHISFVPAVSAAASSGICESASSVALASAYPGEGSWSGNGVEASGSFSPALAGIGTHSITYSSTRTFGTVTKTFSSTTLITVVSSEYEKPVLEQPGDFTLTANIDGPRYQWMKNDSLQAETSGSLHVKGPGIYKVRVSDEKGCFTAFSSPFAISELHSPIVAQIGFATLEAVGNGDVFVWYLNDTLLSENSRRLKISSSGRYQVRGVDTFDNISPLSLSYEGRFPVVPEIERTNLYTIKATLAGARFEWFYNDSLLDANTLEVHALRSGRYKVRVTDSLGTSSNSQPFYSEDNWIHHANEGEDEYQLDISAGDVLRLCPVDTTYTMRGHYPAGGTWSGSGISPDGLIASSRLQAGTTRTVTYSVTKSFRNIIKTYSASKEIFVERLPGISGSSAVLCDHTPALLEAEGPFINQVWSTGDTTRSIIITSAGDYFVQAKYDPSCIITSERFTVGTEYVPPPRIRRNSELQLQATVESVEDERLSFVWMLDDSLVNATTPTVNFFKAGYYKAKAVTESGCESDFSESFYHEHLEDMNQSILIYPNPARNYFNIAVGESCESAVVTITTPKGRQVLNKIFKIHKESAILTIDITGFHQSFYLVSVETISGKVIRKLIVKTAP